MTRCEVCRRPCRPGVLLYLRPGGKECRLCGRKRCEDRYNDEPLELSAQSDPLGPCSVWYNGETRRAGKHCECRPALTTVEPNQEAPPMATAQSSAPTKPAASTNPLSDAGR